MSWLAKCDARAAHWPPPLSYAYLGLKWGLIALGAFALAGVLADRVGLWSLY